MMKIAILPVILIFFASFSHLCGQTRGGVPHQPSKEQKSNVFSSNHSIRLHGKLPTGTIVDVSTFGVGPTFLVEVPLNEEIHSLTCKYSVAEAEGDYQIFYSIGIQVKIEVKIGSGEGNYQFRSYVLEGNTICNSGSSVVIFKNGEETLSLSLAKEAAAE